MLAAPPVRCSAIAPAEATALYRSSGYKAVAKPGPTGIASARSADDGKLEEPVARVAALGNRHRAAREALVGEGVQQDVRVDAAPRVPARTCEVTWVFIETGRGGAAATTWIFRGGGDG